MNLFIEKSPEILGQKAAELAAKLINQAILEKGYASILIATGQSQFEFYKAVLKEKIDWAKVEIFHLDEYMNLPVSHKASFRKYLTERFLNFITPKEAHLINAEDSAEDVIRSLTEKINNSPVDMGLIGIGENGHIAFNDPPADFETDEAFKIVKLDNACKMQQVGEGWFESIDKVPDFAVSATVSQILKCKSIISVVPHKVKAKAVRDTLESPEITNMIPATALKNHPDWHLFLDIESASLLTKK